MTIARNEIHTGLLVLITVSALVGVLIYLGAPGVFVPQKTFRIYFDNASGLEPGAPVLLAGRKIGQVTALHSPVPEKERPDPTMETLVEVQVDKEARIYAKVHARMTQPSMLGKPVIDFTTGQEASGIAPEGTQFIGERQPGLSDAVPTLMEKLDPTLAKATETLESLRKTADNLSTLSKEGSDLPVALAEFRKFGSHLNELTGSESSLRRSLKNIENLTGDKGKLSQSLDNIAGLTGPDGDFAKAMADAHVFTSRLAENKDIDATLANLRRTSASLDTRIKSLMTELNVVAENLEQGTDTLKRQPWRLIWPTTKKYPEDPKPSSSGSRLTLGAHQGKRP